MQIENSKVVHINYILTNTAGDVIDSSENGEPLAYLHGSGNIIKGLEAALAGKTEGDKFSVTIDPKDAYGERNAEFEQQVPRSSFEGVEEINPGMQFQAQSDQGNYLVTVTAVNEQSVTIDANHPLAGETLHFDVEVAGVRDASAQELEHGHVHGPGGHAH